MRKILFCCILFVGIFASCQNKVISIGAIDASVQTTLWQSLWNKVKLEVQDSSVKEPVRPLNYFIREGFAGKFGF